MLVLRDPADTYLIADPGIRRLVEQRFAEVFAVEAYDADQHGYMIVVESSDSVEALEKESGCAILYEPFEDVPFGHPDFTPSFEALEEHHDDKGPSATKCSSSAMTKSLVSPYLFREPKKELTPVCWLCAPSMQAQVPTTQSRQQN